VYDDDTWALEVERMLAELVLASALVWSKPAVAMVPGMSRECEYAVRNRAAGGKLDTRRFCASVLDVRGHEGVEAAGREPAARSEPPGGGGGSVGGGCGDDSERGREREGHEHEEGHERGHGHGGD